MGNAAELLGKGAKDFGQLARVRVFGYFPNVTPAPVTPALLVWARETRGLSIAEAAKRATVKPERLIEWEEGTTQPSVAQAEKLADVYKRPRVVFYLKEPPKGPPPVQDFRSTTPTRSKGSPELLLAERLAHYRRSVAIELAEATSVSPPRFDVSANVEDSAEDVATELRDALGITVATQKSWSDEREAFAAWRDALERLGVLVFHSDKVDPSEARGFSIYDAVYPVVVVNGYDAWTGRIFSLFHEVAHLALRKAGVCLFEEEVEVETWCNQVAADLLMPSASIRDVGPTRTWTSSAIDNLADDYKVSPEAALVRLIHLNIAPRSLYAKRAAEFRKRANAPKSVKSEGSTGGPPPHVMALRRSGPTFARLVFDAMHANRITTADAVKHLGLGVSHLDALEAALARTR